MATVPECDVILDGVFNGLGIGGNTPAQKYGNIVAIVAALQVINANQTIHVATTGKISERLCQLGIDSVPTLAAAMRKYGLNWEWLGDFLLPGHPYDVAVSVKSFKAKERLLASGTGSLLTPTIGWGLFDDATEWSEDRCKSYLYRGFVAIYMPAATLAQVSPPAQNIRNINGNFLLRDMANFSVDLTAAIPAGKDRLDARLL